MRYTNMMNKRQKALQTLSPRMRESIAENMKERVYASITLIAVIAALWQTSEHQTIRGTILTIGGSVVALWLATLISTRMSYRAIHAKSITPKQYQSTIYATSGLLAPAITPILIIALSATGWYELKSALMASMIVLLLSLFLLSYSAGRKIYTNKSRLILMSTLEMSVGLGIIILKLTVGE